MNAVIKQAPCYRDKTGHISFERECPARCWTPVSGGSG